MKIYLHFIFLLFTAFTFSQTTSIPDANFEQRLIDMGYDIGPVDGFVPTANINVITTLFVPNSNISDLTGIEDFTALTTLDCIGNPLTSLDFSNNSNLTFLFTGNNTLSSLNVSNNLLLEGLVCTGHQLTTLDVSNNTALRILRCETGILTDLDLSNNTALEILFCSNNTLTSLDLKNGNNSDLITMRAENNMLSCVDVDDASAANSGSGVYSSWMVDNNVYYSEDCSSCPEINILGNSMSIVSGDDTPDVADHTDFEIVTFGNFEERTFTIENIGDADLNLLGSPIIQITNSTDFTISAAPSTFVLANGGMTSFTVRYTPSQAGTINTATLSISNDDCDENPYTFDVKGQSEASLGIEDEWIKNNVRIIPNPSQGSFYLECSEQHNLVEAKIIDCNGKIIKIIDLLNFNRQEQIYLNLSRGIYFLKLYSEKQSIVKRLVIH